MANALGAGLSIPGTDTGIRDLVTQLGTYRQKSEATAEQAKSDLAGIGREQEAEIGRASEEMAPAQKRVTDVSRQFPEPKARTPMPETPKAPSFDPKEMQDTMGILVAFAALGGALTRQPMTAALNNFSAGVHGLVQGKQQVYDNSLKEFKTNFDTAKAKNDEIWHEWKAAIDKHGADIQGAKDELSMIAARHQLSMQSFLLRSGRIVEATKLTQHAQDVGIQAAEKVTGLMIQDERFRQQGLDRQEQRADRAAQNNATNAFRAATLAQGAERTKSLTGAGASDWTPEEIAHAAESYRAQGPSALVGLPPRSPIRAEIVKRAMQLSMSAGETGAAFGAKRNENMADAASLRKLVPMYDGVSAWTRMVDLNGDVLKDLAKKVDRGGAPVIERFSRAIRRGTDPGEEGADVAEFFAQLRIFNTEVARALTAPNLTGVVTDAARSEIDDMISRGASTTQLNRVVDRLSADSHNRLKTLEGQYKVIDTRMRGGGGLAVGSITGGERATPTAQDRAWAREHPEDAVKFKAHFGVDP